MTSREAVAYALTFLEKHQTSEVYGQPARCRGCERVMHASTAWTHDQNCPHLAAIDRLKRMLEPGAAEGP